MFCEGRGRYGLHQGLLDLRVGQRFCVNRVNVLPLRFRWTLRCGPVLDNQLQPQKIKEIQQALNCEGTRVGLDLRQTVLTDGQFCGKRMLRELESPPTTCENLSKLCAVVQDLSHC